MKNKIRFVTIAGILLIVALALLPFWIRGRRMENRFRADRELFQTTAEAFCDKSAEIDRRVCVYKSDSIEDIFDEYGFSESDISGIKKIFHTSDCNKIYANSRNEIGSYCGFVDGGDETKTGLIYFADAEKVAGKEAEDLETYMPVVIRTFYPGDVAYFVDEQWIYYQGVDMSAID